MKYLSLFVTLALLTSCASQSKQSSQTQASDDPNLWLEEVEGEKALAWVKERNAESEKQLKENSVYKTTERDIRKILLAKDRLPFVSYAKGYVYNFWQDEKNVRGLYRRAKLGDYKKAIVPWQTILDLDQLSKKENENWVWKGITCLSPEERLCLLSLSRGGKDATVIREFDREAKAFVKNGFSLTEAKSDANWVSQDKVFVSTDYGPGTMNKSGYPRQMKIWNRGTPLASAKLVLESTDDELGVNGWTSHEPGKQWHFVGKSLDFYRGKYWLYQKDGALVEIPIPEDAHVRGVFAGNLLYTLKSDLKASDGKVLKQGSLLALNLVNLNSAPELVYEPPVRTAVEDVSITKHTVLVGIVENVQGRILKVQRIADKWEVSRLQGQEREAFQSGNLVIHSAEPLEEIFVARHEDFLAPASIVVGEDSGKGIFLYKVKSAPARFNSNNLISEQFEVKSKDGTLIPYFVIRSKDAKYDGKNPTLLYGYGGFMNSQTPYYLNSIGKVWLERQKGVYVVANIRGGGEFGPAWHEAALKTNRQKAFDDFIAIAEDLIDRKITSKQKLAIMGGSNGGLLVGAVMVQRPDLFKAVVCQVPLLDMLRYHMLLAGHSWVGEYGHPDNPAERAAIEKYSPYQNLKPNRSYPMTLFMTSTKDDRVHPGHARKMMAKMMAFGKPALYWENTEGGHAGAANIEQRVKFSALQWTFLTEQLVLTGAAPRN